jgi:ribosome-associated protein
MLATKKKVSPVRTGLKKTGTGKPAPRATAPRATATKLAAGMRVASRPAVSKLAVAKAGVAKAGVAKAGAAAAAKAARSLKSDLVRGAKVEKADRDKARQVALSVASVGLEHSALNVEIIDVRGKVDYADYVVVMSGRSDRQVSALARHIETELEKKHSERCIGVEGLPTASWLLMDYGDVVVHIFHEDTRGYYDLETLWLDAARVPT